MGTRFIQVFFFNRWCDGGVIFFHQSQTRWWHYSITWGQPQKRSDSLPHIHCLLVDMKYRRLIDVKDKPFDAPLHFDWQPSMLFFAECFVTMTSGGMWCVRSVCYRNAPWQDGSIYLAMTGNEIKWWGATGIAGQAIVTTAIDSWTTDCPWVILMYCFFIKWSTEFILILFTFIQISMMVERCHEPINLDKLMNEGITFSIEQSKSKLTELAVGMQLVMIGRRSRRYDTLEKVMTRLDKIFNVMSVMEQITVHVNVIHWACLLNLLQWLLMFFHLSCSFE